MISLSNIDTLKSIFIKDVDCGDSHTTILLDSGEICTFGNGTKG